jgi:hypothetical protein
MVIALVISVGLSFLMAVIGGGLILLELFRLRSTVDKDRARVAENVRRLGGRIDTAFERITGQGTTLATIAGELASVGQASALASRTAHRALERAERAPVAPVLPPPPLTREALPAAPPLRALAPLPPPVAPPLRAPDREALRAPPLEAPPEDETVMMDRPAPVSVAPVTPTIASAMAPTSARKTIHRPPVRVADPPPPTTRRPTGLEPDATARPVMGPPEPQSPKA